MPDLAPVTIDPATAADDSVFLYAVGHERQRLVAEIPTDDLSPAERDGYAALFAGAKLLHSLCRQAAGYIERTLDRTPGDAPGLRAFVDELRKAVAAADGC